MWGDSGLWNPRCLPQVPSEALPPFNKPGVCLYQFITPEDEFKIIYSHVLFPLKTEKKTSNLSSVHIMSLQGSCHDKGGNTFSLKRAF